MSDERDAEIKRVQGELAKARKEWRWRFKLLRTRCLDAERESDGLQERVQELEGYLRKDRTRA